MRKRSVVVILVWGLVAGCSSSDRPCGDTGPESVAIDAAAYGSPGSNLEVCIIDDTFVPGDEWCNSPGTSEVGVTWSRDAYPKSVDYRVTRTNPDGSVEPLVSGTYLLQCQPGTVRIELGAGPGPG